MFPQEKSKGSAPDLFFLREEGTSVHRLLLQGIWKQISTKPVIIRFSRDTERKILRKRPKNNNKKSMNKDVWSYFKHFGRLPGKIHLFLTPSKTYWRMKRFPASTRHRQKYITHDVVLFAWSTGRGETGSATIVLRLARPLCSQTSSKISPEIILSFSSAINLQCLRNGQKWAVVSNTCSSSSMCSSG